ncbi:MAG: tetratricopeptide repeat protein [Candidatus Zixiibacteriota bacterium]|nr:MAG: tetratricopeptide repeat protein [candidate division Zixibacteria bacterium]
MNRVLTALFALLLVSSVAAEDYIDLVKKGNEAYHQQDYKKALEYYHGAETELPASPELEYNIAGALHHQGGYEETVDRYTSALNTTDVNLEAQAHYNLGNTHFRMGEFEKAIANYQNALEINPDDVDAKFNLELARKRLKEQIKPEQQQQDQQQQQEQEKEQQQQQDQQQQNEQQQGQQQQDQQQQQQEQQPEPEPADDKEMSREDAERILNALRDDEQDLQKQIKRQRKAGDYIGKDW